MRDKYTYSHVIQNYDTHKNTIYTFVPNYGGKDDDLSGQRCDYAD